jgi:stage III sporulation protein SpoIIIAA
MIEAVQNHTPDIIIVDEVRTCCKHAYQRHTNSVLRRCCTSIQIGTRGEASACCTIARRGVMLIATAHGVTLKDVVDNPSVNAVVGGIETVTLSDREMHDRQLKQKTVREAKGPSAFGNRAQVADRVGHSPQRARQR